MKIRTGFVSNSSSSSFIAVGTIHNFDNYDELDALDDYPSLVGEDDGLRKNEYLVADNFVVADDYGMDDGRILITEDMVGKYIVFGTKMT